MLRGIFLIVTNYIIFISLYNTHITKLISLYNNITIISKNEIFI